MNRDQIIKKIKALMAMTTENGSSEAEALAAAKKIGQLQEKYGYTLQESDLKTADLFEDGVNVGGRTRHAITRVAWSIAEYCDCQSYLNRKFTSAYRIAEKHTQFYFGHKSDVEIAVYLTGVLMGAIEREAATYKKSEEYFSTKKFTYPKVSGRKLVNDFKAGCAGRISSRLQQLTALKRQRQKENDTASGTSLVVVKDQVIKNAFHETHGDLAEGRPQPDVKNLEAFTAGEVAGSGVQIVEGVKTEARQKIAG